MVPFEIEEGSMMRKRGVRRLGKDSKFGNIRD